MVGKGNAMRVGVIQSNYIPWRGYFDFIDDVDLFIFYDDVQYTKGTWRNRNRIKSANGLQWITVPVKHDRLAKRIDETRIDASRKWQVKHLKSMRASYGRAPHLAPYLDQYAEIIHAGHEILSDLNVALCKWIMGALGIKTTVRMSREYKLSGTKTERLIDLLTQVGASRYLSGPAGRAYLDGDLFRAHGITLEYKSYDYAPYPQLWGEFDGAVTVLDLLFHTGPEARNHLKSSSPNREA